MYTPQVLLHASWGANQSQAHCILKSPRPLYSHTGLRVFYMSFGVPVNHRTTASQKYLGLSSCILAQGLLHFLWGVSQSKAHCLSKSPRPIYMHTDLRVFNMSFELPADQRPTSSQKALSPFHAYWPQGLLLAIWGAGLSQTY